MESFQETSTRVLQALLAQQPSTPGKVTFAWQIAAGPALARAATVTWADNGSLRVKPKTAAWARELQTGKPMILERLTQLLGPGVVRALVIETSPADPALIANHKSPITNRK